MGLNNIVLAPFLIEKLYENSLVDTSISVSPISNTEKAKDEKLDSNKKNIIERKASENDIKYLGKNAKNILIIVNELSHTFLGDDDLSLLINILNACKISMQDVAVINANENENVVYENINEQFVPSKVIFLGIEPQQLNFPIQIPKYKIQLYNSQQYLCGSTLKELGNNTEEKKQIWGALKKMFGV